MAAMVLSLVGHHVRGHDMDPSTGHAHLSATVPFGGDPVLALADLSASPETTQADDSLLLLAFVTCMGLAVVMAVVVRARRETVWVGSLTLGLRVWPPRQAASSGSPPDTPVELQVLIRV